MYSTHTAKININPGIIHIEESITKTVRHIEVVFSPAVTIKVYPKAPIFEFQVFYHPGVMDYNGAWLCIMSWEVG